MRTEGANVSVMISDGMMVGNKSESPNRIVTLQKLRVDKSY